MDLVNDCYWDFMAKTPVIKMEAEYELNGQIMIFPINAKGKSKNSFHNLVNRHQMKCERYQKKGKTYYRVLEYKQDMHPEKVVLDFGTVMPGNEKISEEITKTANENGVELFKDVKPAFEQVWNTLHMNAANAFFSRFSADELYLK